VCQDLFFNHPCSLWKTDKLRIVMLPRLQAPNEGGQQQSCLLKFSELLFFMFLSHHGMFCSCGPARLVNSYNTFSKFFFGYVAFTRKMLKINCAKLIVMKTTTITNDNQGGNVPASSRTSSFDLAKYNTCVRWANVLNLNHPFLTTK